MGPEFSTAWSPPDSAFSPGPSFRRLTEAATSPPIYKKILEKYHDGLPSDATLKSYLIRELDFNDTYVDGFIKKFLATLAFAKIGKPDTIEDDDDNDGEEPETGGTAPEGKKGKTVAAVASQQLTNAVVRDFPIPLMGGGLAVIKVPVPMSESDFQQITGTLNAWKGALVKAESSPDDDPEE